MKKKNSFGHFLWRIFLKAAAWPFMWLKYRPKVFHQNRNNKSTPIKKGKIIIVNKNSKNDYLMVFFMFWYRKLVTLVNENTINTYMLKKNSRLLDNLLISANQNDFSFLDDAINILKKGNDILLFDDGEININNKVIPFQSIASYLANSTNAEIVPLYIEGEFNKKRRPRVMIGETLKITEPIDLEALSQQQKMFNQTFNAIKNKMHLYEKYHTYCRFDPKWWFLDLAKAFCLFSNWFIFPTKFHYYGKATRKDRHIKGRGVIVSKHQSFVDPPILAMHYFSRRVRTIVAEDAHNAHPWLLDHLGTFQYRRLTSPNDVVCTMTAINILRSDGIVGIYPESHIIKDGLNEFADGAAYFSLVTKSPVYFYVMKYPFKPLHFNHVIIGETLDPCKIFTEEELKDKKTVPIFTKMLHDKFNVLIKELDKYGRKSKVKTQKA